VYIWQQPFFSVHGLKSAAGFADVATFVLLTIQQPLPAVGPITPLPVSITLAAILVVATVSYYALEKPFMALRSRLRVARVRQLSLAPG
jgi:peptidoglycan/LPS O-acetylase OafA/YrhL